MRSISQASAQIVFEIRTRGADDTLAVRTMDNFVEMQRMHVADVDRLERELAAAAE